MRYTEWRDIDEMSYIDDSTNGLSPDERKQWLERYLTACLHRSEWGAVNGQKIINYLEHKLLGKRAII